MAKQKKSKMALYTRQDKIILYCGYALLGLFLLAIIIPMIYIVIASFMDPVTLQNKGISFDFSKWSLDAYQRVVSDKQIWVGFKNAVLYSIIFTIISVAVTMLAAYPMSLPDFKGKTIFNTLFVITMFFSGGLIPTYLLINNLGLLDSMWAVILPGAFSVWNMIIARTYYQGIPRELREAADVDGASEMLYFFKIPASSSMALAKATAMQTKTAISPLPTTGKSSVPPPSRATVMVWTGCTSCMPRSSLTRSASRRSGPPMFPRARLAAMVSASAGMLPTLTT